VFNYLNQTKLFTFKMYLHLTNAVFLATGYLVWLCITT